MLVLAINTTHKILRPHCYVYLCDVDVSLSLVLVVIYCNHKNDELAYMMLHVALFPWHCSHAAAVTERGVNTPSTSTLPRMGTMSQATSILGSEEEEMDAILKELLQAFPKQSRKGLIESIYSVLL